MNIYQHFRPEEREFIDQVLNWKNIVENTYAPKLTDFLDPREATNSKKRYRTGFGNLICFIWRDAKC